MTPRDSRQSAHSLRSIPQQIHIAAWNLSRRSRRLGIPTRALDALSRLDIDVLVLPECADGRHLAKFREGLRDIGLDHIAFSLRAPRQTMVLIASRYPMAGTGLLPLPGYTEAAATNWLHRRLPDFGLELVGLRALTCHAAVDHDGYWRQFESIVHASRERRIIFIGDLGLDPIVSPGQCANAFSRLQHEGFHLAEPRGDWSWHPSTPGSVGLCSDHALASSTVAFAEARYVHKAGGITLAAKDGSGLSEHALLSVRVPILSS